MTVIRFGLKQTSIGESENILVSERMKLIFMMLTSYSKDLLAVDLSYRYVLRVITLLVFIVLNMLLLLIVADGELTIRNEPVIHYR